MFTINIILLQHAVKTNVKSGFSAKMKPFLGHLLNSGKLISDNCATYAKAGYRYYVIIFVKIIILPIFARIEMIHEQKH